MQGIDVLATDREPISYDRETSTVDTSQPPDHPSTDAGIDVQPSDAIAPPRDAAILRDDAISADGGLPTCGDEFVSLRYEATGGAQSSLCLPLPRGVTTNAVGCMVRSVNVNVGDAMQVSVGGLPEITARTGPSMLGIVVQGRELPCGSPNGHCFYRTFGSTCRATIVRSGQVGDEVEVVLIDACELTHSAPEGGPTATMTVLAMRLRGRLRLENEITTGPDGSVPFADCGL